MLIGRYAAVLDACVLHPPFLRASLLWLAKERLFRPLWSDQILDEWAMSIARRNDGITPEKLAGHRKQLIDNFEDAMVAPGDVTLSGLTLPDPKDVHVVSTAVLGKADAIITANLKHFPATELQRLGLEAVHPDRFLVNLIDLDPVRAVTSLKRQRENMTQTLPTVEHYLLKFEKNGLVQTRARLVEYEALL